MMLAAPTTTAITPAMVRNMVVIVQQPFVLIASAPTVSSRSVHGPMFVVLTSCDELDKRLCAVLGLNQLRLAKGLSTNLLSPILRSRLGRGRPVSLGSARHAHPTARPCRAW